MTIGLQKKSDVGALPRASREIPRIARRSLHNEVVSRIRDMIIEGQLPSGERIHEGHLVELLGISRTPLREALKVLAVEGLVDLIPSRGAAVHKLSFKNAQDMMDVICILEEMAGPLTCQNATDEEIHEVRCLHDEMLEFYEQRSRLPYFKLNQEIHSSLVRLSGNESLTQVHEILQSRMKRIRYLGDRIEEEWVAAISDHEEMIQALEARDGKRLSKGMSVHLARSWKRIQSAL